MQHGEMGSLSPFSAAGVFLWGRRQLKCVLRVSKSTEGLGMRRRGGVLAWRALAGVPPQLHRRNSHCCKCEESGISSRVQSRAALAHNPVLEGFPSPPVPPGLFALKPCCHTRPREPADWPSDLTGLLTSPAFPALSVCEGSFHLAALAWLMVEHRPSVAGVCTLFF